MDTATGYPTLAPSEADLLQDIGSSVDPDLAPDLGEAGSSSGTLVNTLDHPCPLLEAKYKQIKEEDMKRKGLGSIKALPEPVCTGCTLWLKVPALIFYTCGGVAVIAAVIMLICRK